MATVADAGNDSYSCQQYWDNRWLEENAESHHVDWLCSYNTLSSIIQPWCKGRPRCSALVLGSGDSPFPEELYDSGVREVVVLDFCSSAMKAVQARNEPAARRGLRCVTADVKAVGFAVPQPSGISDCSQVSPGFDLVIDKGTLDCIVSSSHGRSQAVTAIQNMYAQLKTPGLLLLVSHSPPADRLDMLRQVYWHETQVKQVKCTPWNKLSSSVYEEQLLDLPLDTEPAFELGTAYVYILTK